jgi:hypothetical protein
MDHKSRGSILAALLGTVLFALTCGTAFAEYPVFYAKIENQTSVPVHVHWYWTTKSSSNPSNVTVSVIQPGNTTTFHGKPGQGRMHYWTQTKGESPVKQYIDGDTNPKAWNANLYIKYDNQGHLRIYKPNG